MPGIQLLWPELPYGLLKSVERKFEWSGMNKVE